MTLEQELRQSEARRKQLTDKIKILREGGSTSPDEALQKIQELRESLSALLEGKSYQRVSEVLDVIQSRTEVLAELQAYGDDINKLRDAWNQILGEIKASNRNLQDLNAQLLTDMEERRKLREKQHAVLDKLDQYLTDWL